MKKEFDYEKYFMGTGDISQRKQGKLKIHKFEYRMYNFLKQIKEINGKFCDIGCGGGDFLESANILFPKVELYGCDISEKAIKIAKEISPKNIKYSLIQSGGRLPYEDNSFDLCTSFDVLEHIKNNVPQYYTIINHLYPVFLQKTLI